jgi:hypothetical protein
MAISNGNASKINKMNRASQNVSLGTAFQTAQTDIATLQGRAMYSGSLTAGSVQSNGSAMTLYTAMSSIKGQIVQVTRSGSVMMGGSSIDTYYTVSGGCIVIGNGGDYKVAIGDKAYWLAW